MGTLKKIEKLVLDISILLFVVMLGIVLFQILVRNLFGKSFAQLEELAIIILPWFGFFCATYTLYRGNHVQIEYIDGKLPKTVRRVIFCLIQAVLLLLIGAICYYSFGLAMRQMKVVTPALGWPNGISYIGFPICSPLMAAPLVYNIYKIVCWPEEDGQGIDLLHKGD